MRASRSPSTRRVCSGVRACWLGLGALAALAATACQPQLTLVLVRASDLNATPPFVKLLIRQLDEQQPDVFGPFDVRTFPDEQLAPVPPESAFYIDVIGCQTDAAEECQETTSFVARGCTDIMTLQRDSVVEVEVQMHSAAEGATICPPDAT